MMVEMDVETLADNAVHVGLLTRAQMREARAEADDGSVEALTRLLTRKGYLTSWQRDRLLKGDVAGFFYGGAKILFHIAEGTFARVYRGAKMPGEQPVAVKVLRKRFSADPGAVVRFSQEAEAGMKLNHPNIVRIFDFGEQDKAHYMTMEYVAGSNLREFLKLRHRLDADEALPIILGLAHGLKYSLDHGVTHRDIKGTNVLIGHRGEAKLVDFGLATVGLDDERKMEIAHGQRTVDYSALERTCGSPKGDPRSDIYFLGCVYYQMLTGVLPLPEVESSDMLAKMLKRSFHAIKPLADLRYAPPPELSRIITKMMQVDLKKRYQTMDEVTTELEAYREARQAELSATPAERKTMKEDRERTDEDDMIAAIFEHRTVRQKSVLCVEFQDQIQDAFRKALGGMGYKVMLVRDAERAAERYREEPPDAVVFDVDGLGPEAFDAFLDMHEKAHDDGHELAALVLLGPRQRQLASRLPSDDRLIVLNKPIKMKDVQDAITQLVPTS